MATTQTTTSTQGMNIQVGRVYSFVNKSNYVFIVKVSRVTEKSVFVFKRLNDGTWSKDEYREGVNSFKKFTLQKEIF